MTDTIKSYTSLSFDEFKEALTNNPSMIEVFAPKSNGNDCYQILLNGNRRYFNRGDKLVRQRDSKWEIVKE